MHLRQHHRFPSPQAYIVQEINRKFMIDQKTGERLTDFTVTVVPNISKTQQ